MTCITDDRLMALVRHLSRPVLPRKPLLIHGLTEALTTRASPPSERRSQPAFPFDVNGVGGGDFQRLGAGRLVGAGPSIQWGVGFIIIAISAVGGGSGGNTQAN
jgi:hypothetical protein